jgi:hypothetical protein
MASVVSHRPAGPGRFVPTAAAAAAAGCGGGGPGPESAKDVALVRCVSPGPARVQIPRRTRRLCRHLQVNVVSILRRLGYNRIW